MSSMGIGSKPCLDIRPSSDQINDRSISFSQLGKSKFLLFWHEMSCWITSRFSLSHTHTRIAPKFRNSFVGTLPDVKTATRRPNSIISLSSSASSGGSSVSSSTCNKRASSSGGDEPHTNNNRNSISNSSVTSNNHCRDSLKDKTKLKQEKNVPCKFKYSRSTTVVSQCSTGKSHDWGCGRAIVSCTSFPRSQKVEFLPISHHSVPKNALKIRCGRRWLECRR